jgi:hypothetical protein
MQIFFLFYLIKNNNCQRNINVLIQDKQHLNFYTSAVFTSNASLVPKTDHKLRSLNYTN